MEDLMPPSPPSSPITQDGAGPVGRLGGVIAPIVTPTDEEGRFLPGVMEQLVEHLIGDLDGVFVRGTSGEFAALRTEDALHAAQTVTEAVDGRRPVIVGVGDTSTPRTLDQVRAVADMGADFVAVTTTYYYSANETALKRHFVTIAEHAPVPVLLYHIPQNTHVDFSLQSILELASHENVIGLKDSSGDLFLFQDLLAHRQPGFIVFQGREQLAAASMLAGADGIISALANVAPRLLQSLAASARSEDAKRSRRLQEEVTELARIFEEDNWLAALKAGVEELGFQVGPPVPPTCAVAPETRARIRSRLENAGLIPTERMP